MIVRNGAIGEREVAVVENATPRSPVGPTGDGQPADVDGPVVDVQNEAVVHRSATDGQLCRAWADDVHVLSDSNSERVKKDRLADQAGVELDRVPAARVCVEDRLPQRAQ